MFHFVEVTFGKALKFYEEAEFGDIRMRISEFVISKWLQLNIINLNEVVGFSKYSTDSKNVLIAVRPIEDFYIYSQKRKHVLNLWAKFKITNSSQLKV